MTELRILIISVLILYLSCGQRENNKIDTIESQVAKAKVWSISSSTDWVKNEGLLNVESIIYDKVNQVFYASNGVDYAPGNTGFISKLSETGTLQNLKWIDGLNRPTGMAIQDSLLYVADVNSLVVINTKNGEVVEKFLEPVANSGLNDVVINEKDEVYVSASFVHSVFKLNNGSLEEWSKDEELLAWANGLTATKNQILAAGLHLSTINVNSMRITRTELNSTVKDFDGIVSDDSGGYFLTTVEKRGLYHLDQQKTITTLLEEEDVYFGDLEFDPRHKKIYIPRGNKNTGEFFITVLTLE